ncbi:hypothetical protein BpHYR1_007153, partial [Brachionus plicatilis]
ILKHMLNLTSEIGSSFKIEGDIGNAYFTLSLNKNDLRNLTYNLSNVNNLIEPMSKSKCVFCSTGRQTGVEKVSYIEYPTPLFSWALMVYDCE